MKKLIDILKTTLVGIGAILILVSMAIMVLVNAFPRDIEMDKRAEIAKERAEKRAEGIRELQKQWMEQHK